MTCVASFAQEIKGSPTKASSFLNKGDLANAKLYIEAYLESEKFKKKPKTSAYVVLAQVYMAIAKSENPEDQKLSSDPLAQVNMAFDKVKELSGGKGSDYTKVFNNQGFNATGAITPGMQEEYKLYFLLKGDSLYREGEYEKALDPIRKAMQIAPNDETVYAYGFDCAKNSEIEDEMYKYGEKLMDMKYHYPAPYLALSYDQYAKGSKKDDKAEAKKNYEKMFEYVNRGLENVPDSLNKDLKNRRINCLILLEKTEEAVGQLKKNLEKNPDDETINFTIGAIYEESGDLKKAESYYRESLKQKPDYYEANYRLASVFLTKAKDTFAKLNEEYNPKGGFKNQEKGEALEKQYDSELKQALPFLEKCNELKPKELEILQKLGYLYRNLEMDDKYSKVVELMNQLDEE